MKEIKKKLIEAFKKSGMDLPNVQADKKNPGRKSKHVKVSSKNVTKQTLDPAKSEKRNSGSQAANDKKAPISQKPVKVSVGGLSAYHNPGKGGIEKQKKLSSKGESYRLLMNEESQPKWDNPDSSRNKNIRSFKIIGNQIQSVSWKKRTSNHDRELVLGIDFGTSSVKAVIGDRAIGRRGIAYAVPFRMGESIESFILPCRIFKSGDRYVLNDGEAIADLKLSLLAQPDSDENRLNVVAFLAMVIRQSRAWFLSAHDDVYRSSNLIWRLSIGVPSANHFDTEFVDLFYLLGLAAWIMAGSKSHNISRSEIDNAIERAKLIWKGAKPSDHEDVEVVVIPELAAQIYGYVSSTKFDPNAENNFMIVDIGAGTVDASVFHVQKGRGRKWDFEFYTSSVEPYGAVNLHRYRLSWWKQAVAKLYPKYTGIINKIESSMLVTDFEKPIPMSVEDYFSNTKLEFVGEKINPDRSFYSKVFEQIFHYTYWETSKGFLSRDQLTKLPAYFCGGSSRMPFYHKLLDSNGHRSFQSWMSIAPRKLEKPTDLDAPGLESDQFDRLSVAYGLSFLDVGRVLKAIPRPKVELRVSDSWRDNYIEK